MKLKRILSKTTQLVLIALFTILSTASPAAALTNEQRRVFEKGVSYFNYWMDCDDGSGGDLDISNNHNYKGDQILTDEQIAKIKGFQSKYEAAVAGTSIPWQALAAIHIRESDLGEGPQSNGQGPFQDSHYAVGAGCYSDLVCAGKRAVEELKGIVGADADWSNDDTVKKAFFGYNGMAGVYKRQALALGFDQHGADIGEGSPYVMNRADAKRDPSSNPSGWGQIKYDYGGISYPANNDFGAFVYFKAMGGGGSSSSSSSSSDSSSDDSATSTGKYLWVGDSRTEAYQENGILQNGDDIVARSGEGLDWLKNKGGADEAAGKIDDDTTVVFNMGVNDGESTAVAQGYADELNSLADGAWSKAKQIIVMSVNPVDDSKSTFIKNSQVEAFNNTLKSGLKNSKLKWLDTYSSLKGSDLGFDSEGVHYNKETYKKIYDMARSGSTSSTGSSECEDTSTGGASGNVGDADALAAEFEKDTNNTGDVDGAYGRQCVDLSLWFIKYKTTLNPASDNGNAFTKALVAANPQLKETTSTVESAPAIFSVDNGQMGSHNPSYGHTGVVVAVDGDGTIHTIETGHAAGKVWQGTYSKAEYQGARFVSVKDYLK